MRLPLPNPLRYRRLELRCEVLDTDQPRVILNRPEAVAAFGSALLDSPQEILLWIAVDSGKRVLAIKELFRGTVDACLVHPREVFCAALALAPTLCGLFVLHNHPSGSCQPSTEDIALYNRLTEAGELLQIPVLDCLILAEQGFWARSTGCVCAAPSYTQPLVDIDQDDAMLARAAAARRRASA